MTTAVSNTRKAIHIHLAALEGVDEVHVYLTDDAADEELSETPPTVATPTATPGSGVFTADPEVMLERLCDYANAENLRTVFAGCVDLGYMPHTPKIRKVGKRQESYLRWTDPVTGGPATLYVDSASASFYRATDRAALLALPGAVAVDGGVRFSIATAEGVAQALQAAATVKA